MKEELLVLTADDVNMLRRFLWTVSPQWREACKYLREGIINKQVVIHRTEKGMSIELTLGESMIKRLIGIQKGI